MAIVVVVVHMIFRDYKNLLIYILIVTIPYSDVFDP